MELPDELDALLNSGKPVTAEEKQDILQKLGYGPVDKEAILKKIEDRFLTVKPAIPAHWLPEFQMYFDQPKIIEMCSLNDLAIDAGRIN